MRLPARRQAAGGSAGVTRSIADVTPPETLQAVRACQQSAAVAAKAKA